ncbi:MAG: glycosyltransferase [Patescibacteria group bacterium]|nr:glycosyltransferase [Patescibacteria group bacterium]
MKFVVIIPTYNEADNVEKLIRTIEAETSSIAGHEISLLFVDGNSPDGTAALIRKMQPEFGNIELLVEESKRGLGAAYITGMTHAMKNMAADVVVEMDADFQHDPADLKRFVVQIDNGADYVIGSRFTKGGSIPKDWGFYRKFLSVAGNIFTRVVLNLPKISDYTTGYKASRVKGFLDQIDLEHLESRGFAYKMHLLVEMVDHGAKIKEIPIHFANREKGVSKMEGNNPLDSLKVVLKIRVKKSHRFIKFLIVGFVGLVINFVGYQFFFAVFKIHPALSNLIGAEGAIISNYYFNNRWTFSDRKHIDLKQFLVKFVHFNLASAFGVIFIQSGLIFVFTYFFGTELHILFFFLATAVLVIYNFTVYSRVIWRAVEKI